MTKWSSELLPQPSESDRLRIELRQSRIRLLETLGNIIQVKSEKVLYGEQDLERLLDQLLSIIALKNKEET